MCSGENSEEISTKFSRARGSFVYCTRGVHYIHMKALIKLILGAIAVFATSYILPGMHVKDFWTAVIVALVLAIVNVLIRPILVLLTFPVTIVTLGLFLFVINSLMVLLVARIVPGFVVDGFWWAMLASVVISIVNGFLSAIAE